MRSWLLLIVSFISVFPVLHAFAQKKEDSQKEEMKIGIMAKSYEKSVALRWAPGDYITWDQGKRFGYHIFRQEVVNGQRFGAFVQLTQQPIKPVTPEVFRTYTDTSEIAKKALFAVAPDDIQDASVADALKNQESRNFNFSMSLIMSNMYPLVAKLSGMYYKDNTPENFHTYYYEVRVASKENNPAKTWVTATPGKKASMPKPYQFMGRSLKRNAVLQWRTDFAGFSYAYYDVYRSTHPDKHFKKINQMPYVGFIGNPDDKNVTKFQDTLPRIDRSYYYKMVGVDPFGDPGPWSDVVMIKAKQSIYYNPVIDTAYSPDNKKVVVKWGHPQEDKKHLKGFLVQRSSDPLKPYTFLTKELLSHSHTHFEDKKPLEAGYYRILSVGIADDTTYSLNQVVILVDSIPPITPQGIVGKGDTNNVITLHWHPNKENDFFGYRVFRTFGNMGEYTRMNDFLKDTVFTDTIAKSTGYKKAFYTLVALDGHFNSSPYSKALEVRLPDLDPPSPPKIVDYQIKPNTVYLRWNKSLSWDVEYHVLLRKGHLDATWAPLDTVRKGTKADALSHFTDTSATPNMEYLYAVQAVDDYGLKSELSSPLKVTALGHPFKPMVQGLQAFVSTPNNMIKLVWQYNQPGVSAFVIYRKSKEGKMQILQTLPSGAREHYDKSVQPNSLYTYYIMAHFTDWSQSKLSDALTVNY